MVLVNGGCEGVSCRPLTIKNYVHDGARWYNTITGNFTSQDTSSYLDNPANGNRYAYAADSPLNNIDPTGQNSILNDVIGGVAGLVAGTTAAFLTGNPLIVAAAAGCVGFGVSDALNHDTINQSVEGCAIGGTFGLASTYLGQKGLDWYSNSQK